METYYTTECGCYHTRQTLGRGGQAHDYRLICPQHGGFLESKFSFCEECGAEIKCQNTQVIAAKKCLDCNPALQRKKKYQEKKRKQVEIKISDEKMMEILIDRSDCVCRPLCCIVHIRGTAEILPCYNCPDYKPKKLMEEVLYTLNLEELDSTVKSQDPDTQARGLSTWGEIFKKRQRDLQRKFAK